MRSPKNKFLSLLLIAGLCLCLTVSLSLFVYHSQQKQLEARFEEHAQQILASLQREIDFSLYVSRGTSDVQPHSREFLSKALPIGQIVERALKFLAKKSLQLYLYDESAGARQRFLYAHQAATENFKAVLQKTKYLYLAKRVWAVVFIADRQYLSQEISRDHWKIFGIGVLLTALIVLNLKQHILRSEEIERQVVLRTRELAEANEDLRRFNRLAVGRELRMIELKKEINELTKSLGQKPRYEIKQ